MSVLIFPNLFAADPPNINVKQHDKGFFGYQWVEEQHEGSNHNLSCHDPGFSSCKFIVAPTSINLGELNGLIENIENMIQNGQESGSDGTVNLNAVWSHSSGTYTISIGLN